LNTCVGEAQICTKIIAILLMMHIPVVGNEWEIPFQRT
jgi:hypothetical protein